MADQSRMQRDENIDPGYEAPAIAVLGPVEELTLGGGGTSPEDANATYTGISDARIKRGVRRMPDVISRLRRLGESTKA